MCLTDNYSYEVIIQLLKILVSCQWNTARQNPKHKFCTKTFISNKQLAAKFAIICNKHILLKLLLLELFSLGHSRWLCKAA